MTLDQLATYLATLPPEDREKLWANQQLTECAASAKEKTNAD